MNADLDRRWRRHMADEAAAIAAQQARAGDGHAPVGEGAPAAADHGRTARDSAARARQDCTRELQVLIDEFRERPGGLVPIAELEGLATRMRGVRQRG